MLEGTSSRVNIVIKSVDHAPDDLGTQTPLRGRLLRTIAGHNRSNCWLVELRTPVSWTTDGATRTIRHLVVWARWQGTSIGPGAALPVGIAYVIDDSIFQSTSFDSAQAEYVAIGFAKVGWSSSIWSRLWTRLFRRPDRPERRGRRARTVRPDPT